MTRVAARRVGLLCLSAFLFWLVCLRGYSDYLARVLPERALALNPSQPEALLRAAESALRAHRLEDADRLARRALMEAPMTGSALRVLGAVAELHGEQARARALIELGVAVTPRDTAGQFWLAINALARRDLGDCLLRLDRLLRVEPEVAGDAFPILATIAVSPAGVGAIAGTLAQDPPWRGSFIRQLIGQAPAAADLLRLFRAIARHGGLVHEGEWDGLIGRLIAAGDWKRLHRVLSERPSFSSADGLLRDGVFDGVGHGPVFGWTIDRVPGADALVAEDPTAPGNRALYLHFYDRRVPFKHVYQILLLPPGSYRLIGRVRLSRLETPQGLAWNLTCAPGSAEIGRSKLMQGTADWREFSIAFQVPEDNCGGQNLRLAVQARIAAEQQIVGEAWFDDFRIELTQAAANAADKPSNVLETDSRSR